jgi:hypothetical protein
VEVDVVVKHMLGRMKEILGEDIEEGETYG